MKYLIVLYVVLCNFLFDATTFAQTQSKPITMLPTDSTTILKSDSSSPVTFIITKIPFNGANYFIKIVPLDPALIELMPIYNPEGGRSIIWKDSLQRLLPDSLLKYLPKRQDLNRKPRK